jgi:catechol 2,3-dioxygenase-like lactoylglutathione lyase family enzyme
MIVPDIEQSMERLGADLALTWRPIQEGAKAWTDEFGEIHPYRLRVTASRGTPAALELIQWAEGDWREYPNGSLYHHLGFWVDDLPTRAKHLKERGWEILEAENDAEGVLVNYAYFRSPYGLIVELVDSTIDRPWVDDLRPTGIWCSCGAASP